MNLTSSGMAEQTYSQDFTSMRSNDAKTNDLVDPANDAETWKERYAIAKTNQDRMFKRFADWYDSLYAQIGQVTSPWRSKIYVPILAQQTKALLAKFLTLKPGFQVTVRDIDLDDETISDKVEKAQEKLQFDYDNDLFEESMRDKQFGPLMDALVCGTGMAKVAWTTYDRKVYSKLKDQYGSTDLSKVKVKTIKEGYNDLIPINIFNVFVSPAAKNLYKAPWIIIKEYKPISELEAVNKAEGVRIYKNLDKLNGKVSYDQYAAYDRSRNRLLANADPTDKTVRMVAIYECYEGDTISTYAESGNTDSGEGHGWLLLRKQKNVYNHGKYPLVKFHTQKKPFQFWGEGIFEITYRLQQAVNDVVNHFQDAMNVAYDPMMIAPETANIDDYVIEPAALIQYSGDVAPQAFSYPEPKAEMLETPLNMLTQAIEGVTINQYASGVPNDQTDKTHGTAAGITRLQEAAGDIVTFFKQNYQQTLNQIGKMWLSNNQQFMIRPITVNLNTPQGPKSTIVKPEDLEGDLDVSVDESSMEPLTDTDRMSKFKSYIQDLIMLQNQSFLQNQHIGTQPAALDFTKLSDDLSEQYNIKNFNKILVPQQEIDRLHQQQMMQAAIHVQQAGLMQQQQQAGKAQAAQQPKSLTEQLGIKFETLPEDVQQDLIRQIFGINPQTPSPTEKKLMLDAVGKVNEVGQTKHSAGMDKLNLAHDVTQAHVANAQQQQQMEQEAAEPDETAGDSETNE